MENTEGGAFVGRRIPGILLLVAYQEFYYCTTTVVIPGN